MGARAPKPVAARDPVPMELFGRDHWSTLLYLETRCVDHGGKPAIAHMRCDPHRHPDLAHTKWTEDIPTRAKGYSLAKHDDWDCVEDLIAAGLLRRLPRTPAAKALSTEEYASRMQERRAITVGVYTLTDEGWRVVGQLRRYRAEGGNSDKFTAAQS